MACPMLYTHLNTQTIKAYAVQTLSNQFIVRKKQLTTYIINIYYDIDSETLSPGDLFTG